MPEFLPLSEEICDKCMKEDWIKSGFKEVSRRKVKDLSVWFCPGNGGTACREGGIMSNCPYRFEHAVAVGLGS